MRAAAREVFAELGYVNARVEDVVTRADVSHGTFYTYYDNKAAVLLDLVEATAARVRAIAEAPWGTGADGRGTVRGTLEAVIGQFLQVFADEADVVRTWVEAAAVDHEFANRLAALRDGFVDRVADQLAPAARAGGHDPRTCASALVAMVEGYAIEHPPATRPDGRVPEQAVRTLAALWYGALLGIAEPRPAS